MKSFYFPFAILLLMSIYSCKTTQLFDMKKSEAQALEIDSLMELQQNFEYKIRKDDKITISVWGQDDLSVGSTYGIYNSNEVYGKWLMVDAQGNIEIPRLGTSNVEGMTIIQLKDSLRNLMEEWLVNPIVDIKILNREISLLGEFRNPQVVTIDKENNSLLTMVAVAGGFDKYANLKQVKVLRQMGEDVQIITADLSKSGDYRLKNLPLYPGDIVIAPSKNYKTFDQRISVILPFTSLMTASAIFLGI